jgi:hypothetical protein
LTGADLSKANLSWAKLYGADLREANLREATLSKADLNHAVYDDRARFPEGFDPKAHGLTTTVPNQESVNPERAE